MLAGFAEVRVDASTLAGPLLAGLGFEPMGTHSKAVAGVDFENTWFRMTVGG